MDAGHRTGKESRCGRKGGVEIMRSTGTKRSEMNRGGNLTGVQTAPELAEEMINGAMAAEPSMDGGPELADAERAEYISEGFSLGSMPGLPLTEEADASDEAY